VADQMPQVRYVGALTRTVRRSSWGGDSPTVQCRRAPESGEPRVRVTT
jgi:hypothetical protein